MTKTAKQGNNLKAHADVFGRARGINFGLSIHLHPNHVYVSSKGSGKTD